MKNYNNFFEIKSLKEEVFMVQFDKKCNNFDKKMAEDRKRKLKCIKIIFIPFGILAGIGIITLNTIPIIIGTAYMGISTIIKETIDVKRDLNKLNDFSIKKKTPFDNDDNEDIYEPDLIVSDADFYTEEYKEVVSNLTEEEKRVEQIEIPDLNKEQTIKRIITEYDVYCDSYKLPKMVVSNREWDVLCDEIYDYLKSLDLEKYYYKYMSYLLRYVLASSLVNQDHRITIYSFLDLLNSLNVYISNEDIEYIRQEIIKKLSPSNKITDISSLKLKNQK